MPNATHSDKPVNIKWNRPKISYLKYFIIFHRLCTKHKSMAEPLWPFSSHLSVYKTDVLPTTRVESTFFFILKNVQAMLEKNKGNTIWRKQSGYFRFEDLPGEEGPCSLSKLPCFPKFLQFFLIVPCLTYRSAYQFPPPSTSSWSRIPKTGSCPFSPTIFCPCSSKPLGDHPFYLPKNFWGSNVKVRSRPEDSSL